MITVTLWRLLWIWFILKYICKSNKPLYWALYRVPHPGFELGSTILFLMITIMLRTSPNIVAINAWLYFVGCILKHLHFYFLLIKLFLLPIILFIYDVSTVYQQTFILHFCTISIGCSYCLSSAIVITIGNEIGNQNSNWGWSCVSTCTNALGKGMNPFVLPFPAW